MRPERWQQIDKLFQTVVELEPHNRAVFLERACSEDRALRSQLDSLLESDLLEWEFIEKPALESAALLLADEENRLTFGQKVSHYEIVELIGKGGMGEVYLARDRILNRMVALKLLPSEYTQDADRLRRFQREAQTVSALNHPNILTIHEFGSFDDHQYIATELIEGETLRERLKVGRLPVSEVLAIGIQLTAALLAAHRAGIIHRDIKPENIMLRPDGYVKILDFGLAKLAEQLDDLPQRDGEIPVNISSHLLMGTPRYMPPEQIRGLRVDVRSDIFSLGAVLYEMLAGQPAFDNKDSAELANSILHLTPPSLGIYADDLPAGLSDIISKMLSKDPAERHQNVADVLNDLKAIENKLEITGAKRQYKGVIGFVNTIGRGWIALSLLVVLFFGVIAYRTNIFSTNGALTSNSTNSGTWTFKAPISAPRIDAVPVVVNDELYIVGGQNGCTPFRDVEIYDSDRDVWTKRSPMLIGRGDHGVAALDGQIYAVGGSIGCGNPTDSVETYDPKTDTWSMKASLPFARASHVLATAEGKLYAIGGKSSDENVLSLNTQYDPINDKWTEMSPMPTPRIGAGVAVVDGLVYVIGGADPSRSYTVVEVYDPKTNVWTTRQSMLKRHDRLAVAEFEGKIYAIGGTGSHMSAEVYDPARDVWSDIAELPGRRYDSHAVAFRESIFVVGGMDGANYLSSVLSFTQQPNLEPTVQQCPTLRVSSKSPMPTGRYGAYAAAIGGIAYVIGGYNDQTFLNVNEVYVPSSDSWTEKAPMPSKLQTWVPSGAVVGEKLYVIGGNAEGKCTNLNQIYDSVSNTWSTGRPMPTPRCHLAVVAHGDLIYAIGGTNTRGNIFYGTVEVYDPALDKWSRAASMPYGLHDIATVSLNDQIYVVGGRNPTLSQDELNVVEAFNPQSGSWIRKAPMNAGRRGMSVAVMNGFLVVIHGYSNEQLQSSAEIYDPARNVWIWRTTTATARSYSSALVIDDVLYVFGGEFEDLSNSAASSGAFTLSLCAQ